MTGGARPAGVQQGAEAMHGDAPSPSSPTERDAGNQREKGNAAAEWLGRPDLSDVMGTSTGLTTKRRCQKGEMSDTNEIRRSGSSDLMGSGSAVHSTTSPQALPQFDLGSIFPLRAPGGPSRRDRVRWYLRAARTPAHIRRRRTHAENGRARKHMHGRLLPRTRRKTPPGSLARRCQCTLVCLLHPLLGDGLR